MTLPILLFLKAAIKTQIRVPGFYKKDGTYVKPHVRTVLVDPQKDKAAVLAGAGSHYQKLAHKLVRQHVQGWDGLSDSDKHAILLAHATDLQQAASASAAVSAWRKAALAGKNPSRSMWAAFRNLPADRRANLIDEVRARVGSVEHLVDAPVGSASGVAGKGAAPREVDLRPEQVAALDMIPWDRARLPESNTNARAHNKVVDQIERLARAGDLAGLQAIADRKASGRQTYVRAQHRLALAAISALQATGGQPAAPAPEAAPGSAAPAQAEQAASDVTGQGDLQTLPQVQARLEAMADAGELVMQTVRGAMGGWMRIFGVLKDGVVRTQRSVYHPTGAAPMGDGWSPVPKQDVAAYLSYLRRGRRGAFADAARRMVWLAVNERQIVEEGGAAHVRQQEGERAYRASQNRLADAPKVDPASLSVGDVFVDHNGVRWRVVSADPRSPEFVEEGGDPDRVVTHGVLRGTVERSAARPAGSTSSGAQAGPALSVRGLPPEQRQVFFELRNQRNAAQFYQLPKEEKALARQQAKLDGIRAQLREVESIIAFSRANNLHSEVERLLAIRDEISSREERERRALRAQEEVVERLRGKVRLLSDRLGRMVAGTEDPYFDPASGRSLTDPSARAEYERSQAQAGRAYMAAASASARRAGGSRGGVRGAALP